MKALRRCVLAVEADGRTTGSRMADGVSPLRICTETIYRFAYSQHGRELMMLYRHLPEGRRVRRRREAASHAVLISLSIAAFSGRDQGTQQFRPLGMRSDGVPQGVGSEQSHSLVERKSRYTLLMKNNDRQSLPIMEKIITALGPLPAPACQSFTFDRGGEFMGWRHLKDGLGARSYFCEPNSPWQKGIVGEHQPADPALSRSEYHPAQMSRLPHARRNLHAPHELNFPHPTPVALTSLT